MLLLWKLISNLKKKIAYTKKKRILLLLCSSCSAIASELAKVWIYNIQIAPQQKQLFLTGNGKERIATKSQRKANMLIYMCIYNYILQNKTFDSNLQFCAGFVHFTAIVGICAFTSTILLLAFVVHLLSFHFGDFLYF